ncbi:hypothetical protein FGADI_13528 [Fusarium gaditjirri]|uniref:Major facilitator superfamily (MFS) profile domain-containing protein n=1 Tax=Fusarium gaditjirri TaxID=282569 RepID=A0A8H4SPB1_9HYPO|nr:hypothetical protein FGADI_13528 [Fusarium gaditjirri]
MILESENEKAKSPSTQECPSAEERNATVGNDTPSTPGTQYPSGLRLTSLIVGLCLAVLLVALDNTIIATAIPRISDDFKSLDDIGWYGSSYLLTTCAFQLLFGKLYTLFDIKWVFIDTMVLFEVGSAICGAAPTSEALIVGRAIAGLGSAGIFQGAIIIIAYSVPMDKRPVYNGMFGSVYGVASVLGPLLGGAFVDHVSWRWCFYINLPVGAAAMLTAIFTVRIPKQKNPSQDSSWMSCVNDLDPLGTICFLPGVVCLLLALQWGGTKYPWSSGKVIGVLALGVVLLAAFIAVQMWKGDKATVPPRIFRQRTLVSASIFTLLLSAAYFAIVFYIPIWFQAIKGVSAVKSGIMCLPMILSVVIFSLVAGGGVTTMGHYVPFAYASCILTTIGAGLITTFETDTGHPKWIGYQFLFGAGVGCGIQLGIIASQVVLKEADIPIGTAIITLCQMLGGAISISAAQSIFGNLLGHKISQTVGESSNILTQVGATDLKGVVDPRFYDRVLEAYNDALTETWYLSVALAALSIVGVIRMEWKSVKKSAEAK